MEWLVIVAIVVVVYVIVVNKKGNLSFWKLVQKYPREAQNFFEQDPAWEIVQLYDTSEEANRIKSTMDAYTFIAPNSQKTHVYCVQDSEEMNRSQERFKEHIKNL
jgi:hypothetical protein